MRPRDCTPNHGELAFRKALLVHLGVESVDPESILQIMESLLALHEESSAKRLSQLTAQLTKLAKRVDVSRNPKESNRELIERVRDVIHGEWQEEPPTNRHGHVYDVPVTPKGPKGFVPLSIDATGVAPPVKIVVPIQGPTGMSGPRTRMIGSSGPSGATGISGVTGPVGPMSQPEDLYHSEVTPVGGELQCWKDEERYSIMLCGIESDTGGPRVRMMDFDGEQFLYPGEVKGVWAPFRPLDKTDIPKQIEGRAVEVPSQLLCFIVCRRIAWSKAAPPGGGIAGRKPDGTNWMDDTVLKEAWRMFDSTWKDPFWKEYVERAIKTFHVGHIMES